MGKIIIVNNGSTSKKYGLYDKENLLLLAYFEKNENGEFKVGLTDEKYFEKNEKINHEQFNNSFAYFINLLLSRGLIESEDDVSATAVRIVAPGKYFQEDQIITSEFLEKLEETKEVSPIHIDNTRKEIGKILDVLPKAELIAISDSAFHANKNLSASLYAIPQKFIEEYDIRKFGYHGISIQSAVEKIKKNGNLPAKIIICHLGGGSSITAVKDGVSIENSMGFSPLDGLPMATRSGHLDIGAVLYLMDKEDLEIDEMRDLLFNKSGILGLSGISDDTRVLLNEYQRGNQKAKITLDYYVYEIQKIIGSYFVILGGLDLLVFTGTIGERAEKIREMVVSGLSSLGLEIDPSLNIQNDEKDAYINKPGSQVSIAIVKTDEMAQMAKNTYKII